MSTSAQHQRLILAFLIILAVMLGILVVKPNLLVQGRNMAAASEIQQGTLGTPAQSVHSQAAETQAAQGSQTLAAKPSAVARTKGTQLAANAPVKKKRKNLLVRITHDLTAYSTPGGKAIGIVPSKSKYMKADVTAWVLQVSADGQWGQVPIPFTNGRTKGWIKLAGLPRSTSNIVVRVKLSAHDLYVEQSGKPVLRFHAGTGAAQSPTPTGLYFVTERISNPGGPFGSFIFGLSGLQPDPPPGWTGPAQLAIHGTNKPSTIGVSASAGCLHMSKEALDKLKPLLKAGTPVIFER